MSSRTPLTPASSDRAHLSLLAEISRDHYLEQKSKVQIAQDHDLSRFQVAALLQEARERGIVRISISVPSDSQDLEAARTLGIEELVSVEPASAARGAEPLARALAAIVAERSAGDTTVGISWSRTIQAMAPFLPDMPDSVLVQLAGAIAPTDSTDAVPRLLANLTAKASLPLWAPLVIEEGAAALRRSPEVARTLMQAQDLDLAVIAVGAWTPGLSTVWDRTPEAIREEARRSGAVAEVSGHLLSLDGKPVASALDDMIISASLDDLRGARHTVVVAHGVERAEAVLAAVRAGLVDTLVCDAPLRDALLSLHRG